MFERFSHRARRAVFHARNEALARHANEIELNDLVLGLCRDPHQPNCPFSKLHEEEARIRTILEAGPIAPAFPKDKVIRLSKTSKKALVYAAEEAARDRQQTIGSDHLLRGVLLTDEPVVAQLTEAGYSLAAMREGSKQAHCSVHDEIPLGKFDELAPHVWRKPSFPQRHLHIAIGFLLVLAALLYLQTQN